MRAGLIPSRMLQEKRIAYERAHSANNNGDSLVGKSHSPPPPFLLIHSDLALTPSSKASGIDYPSLKSINQTRSINKERW